VLVPMLGFSITIVGAMCYSLVYTVLILVLVMNLEFKDTEKTAPKPPTREASSGSLLREEIAAKICAIFPYWGA